MKRIIFLIISLVVVIAIALFVLEFVKKATCCKPLPPSPSIANVISVSNMHNGDSVSSPVFIQGQARGPWYFEAVFPVAILDANRNVIGQGHAEAKGEWMTEDFVPFEATVSFTKPVGMNATGTVVLEKDNPSGMPENEQSLEIPVTFK